ncbi:MAG: DUF559 domain-containing protein [Actinomycetota bacterium]|nr:DUF559 domain-containing protein [Actinomycetota bacterium]
MWDEGAIRSHARNSHGLVTRPRLLAAGATDHEIVGRLDGGRLEELHPGVYYLDATPATWKTTLLAAVLAAGPAAAASHRSAGVLWGLDGIYGRTIEVTVPFNDEPEPKAVILHRSRRGVHPVSHQGIPVTTVERTLLDLASLLPGPTLEKAVASAIRKKLATVESIDLCIARFGGRGVKGTRKLRRVLRLVERDKSGAPSEIDMAQLIRDAPIPTPVQQLKIPRPSGSNAYPDFAWPDRMKFVEVDGFDAHSSPDQQEHDLERQNELMALGWDFRRFSAREVRRNPQEVIAEIVRFVSDRSVRVSYA